MVGFYTILKVNLKGFAGKLFVGERERLKGWWWGEWKMMPSFWPEKLQEWQLLWTELGKTFEGTQLVRLVLETMSAILVILRGPLDILVEISNRQFDV